MYGFRPEHCHRACCELFTVNMIVNVRCAACNSLESTRMNGRCSPDFEKVTITIDFEPNTVQRPRRKAGRRYKHLDRLRAKALDYNLRPASVLSVVRSEGRGHTAVGL